jgi:prepilin-type N-terminal cleavage/methylation domain-containing protein
MTSRLPAHTSLRRAFTLLELLLVLTLIGISTATIVPHLNGTLGRWQLRETARNLQTTLQVASQWAGVRQEAIVFAVDVKQGVFCLRPLESGSPAARDVPPTGRQSFGRDVEMTRTEGLTEAGKEKILVFRPDGTARAAQLVLKSTRADANRETLWQITVDGRGAVSCQERLADETGK